MTQHKDGDDHQLRKRNGLDTLSRWAIGIVLLAVTGGLTFFFQAYLAGAVEKTAAAQGRADAAFTLATAADKQMAVMSSKLETFEVMLVEVRKDQKELLTRLPKR